MSEGGGGEGGDIPVKRKDQGRGGGGEEGRENRLPGGRPSKHILSRLRDNKFRITSRRDREQRLSNDVII